MAQGHDRFTVLLQPDPQPRPLPQQRLVGHLDGRLPCLGMVIQREQPGLSPRLDHRQDLAGGACCDRELGAQRPAPGRFAIGADDDEPLEQPADPLAGGIVEPRVQLLGPRRDGGVDTPQRPVRRQREVAVGLRAASSYSVNWSDGSAAGSCSTAPTSSAASAGSTRPPTRSAGPTMAASSSAADMAAMGTVLSAMADANRSKRKGRS